VDAADEAPAPEKVGWVKRGSDPGRPDQSKSFPMVFQAGLRPSLPPLLKSAVLGPPPLVVRFPRREN